MVVIVVSVVVFVMVVVLNSFGTCVEVVVCVEVVPGWVVLFFVELVVVVVVELVVVVLVGWFFRHMRMHWFFVSKLPSQVRHAFSSSFSIDWTPTAMSRIIIFFISSFFQLAFSTSKECSISVEVVSVETTLIFTPYSREKKKMRISKLVERSDFELASSRNDFYNQLDGLAVIGVLLKSVTNSDGYHFNERNDILYRFVTRMFIALDENFIVKLQVNHTKPEDCTKSELPIGCIIYASPVYISSTTMLDFSPNFGEGVQFGRLSGTKIYRWRTILCFNNDANLSGFLVSLLL